MQYANRDLDELIASRVKNIDPEFYEGSRLKKYSLDIEEAFQVVNWMIGHYKKNFKLLISQEGCEAEFSGGMPCFAPKAPEAICLAALNAVGIKLKLNKCGCLSEDKE